MREFKVTESKVIEEGKHSGKIIRVEYRDEPYKYADIIVEMEEGAFELKYGCPQNITNVSKLGKLLELFGMNLVTNSLVTEEDIAKLLVEKKVVFVTLNEVVKRKDGSNGEFARIAEGSLKPVK
jgi:hypothetical protein